MTPLSTVTPPACSIRIRGDRPTDAVAPVTTGVAFAKGSCRHEASLVLEDASGQPYPVQTRVLERWSDDSLRWVLVDGQVHGDADLRLRIVDGPAPSPPHPSPLAVTAADGHVLVSSGPLDVRLDGRGQTPLTAVRRGAVSLIDAQRTRVLVENAAGEMHLLQLDTIEVEEAGPLRVAVQLRGTIALEATVRVACRVELFAGLPVARLRLTLHNPRAATHPGGYWELGDPGSIALRRVALDIGMPAAPGTASVAYSLDPAAERRDCAPPFTVHQEASGGESWQSAVHVDRQGTIPMSHRGYRCDAGGERGEGDRARPLVVARRGPVAIGVTSARFWELFPKAFIVDDRNAVSVEILPAGAHELQGGEQLTYEMALSFGEADGTVLEPFRTPPTVIVDPTWWAAAGDITALAPVADPAAPYEQLVRAAVEGPETFAAKRERIDEYGWRHYGDLYADHENGTAAGAPLVVSHYNNQYDGVFGLLVQFLRSGDPRYWHLASDLAVHIAHIDIYWTDQDKSAYNGGLFWHTAHYAAAGRSTHRSYPRADGVHGGGPSSEHNYSTGLMLFYFLTGQPWSRDAVLRLARWSVDMDDGRLTVFRWLASSPTGLASATGSPDYHGPGRGPANVIHTLLNAWRLTRDRAWLGKVDELIRRVAHPQDDLEARQLLDAERRWYYTVYLQMLGRYLATKSELGEEDATWHYARGTLLHYARWMVAHEYPYLDKPAILEYPTETWAAQDMRKCEVFDLAAVYAASVEERDAFIERARFFFASSVNTLSTWPTRTWTRPVVLMLSYGYAHQWHEHHRERPVLLLVQHDVGTPQPFESQRRIAMRRARMLAVGIGLVVTGAAIGLIAMLAA